MTRARCVAPAAGFIAGALLLSSLLLPAPGAFALGSLIGWDCRIPYPLRIDRIDAEFGFTSGAVEAALREAIALWEAHAPEPLFSLVDHGAATVVSLRYDDRQALREAFAQEVEQQDRTAAALNRQRAELEAATVDYERRLEAFDRERDRYHRALAALDEDVAQFNRSRTRDEAERARLEREHVRLEAERTRLDERMQALEREHEGITRGTQRFNREVAVFNARVGDAEVWADAVGTQTAAQYVRSDAGSRIHVYVAGTETDLVHVLAHELGHALGIGHVDDPDAIMSAVSAAPAVGRRGDIALAPADIAALEAVCREQF